MHRCAPRWRRIRRAEWRPVPDAASGPGPRRCRNAGPTAAAWADRQGVSALRASASGRSTPIFSRRRCASSSARSKNPMGWCASIAASMAASAQRNASAALALSVGERATPITTAACSDTPAVCRGSSALARTARARPGSLLSDVPSTSTRKRAVSMRATRPVSPCQRVSCAERCRIISSAIPEPRPADNSCRLVMPIITIAVSTAGFCCDLAFSHSSACLRLGRPVASSWRATCSNCASRCAIPACIPLKASARLASSWPPAAST